MSLLKTLKGQILLVSVGCLVAGLLALTAANYLTARSQAYASLTAQSQALAQSHIEALRDWARSKSLVVASAAAALEDFAKSAGLSLGTGLASFSARVAAVAGEGLDPSAIRYDAAFGRPLDYYTGLVFEIAPAGEAVVLAGGGRFDRLLTLLGAKEHIPAVGFSLWLDRIAGVKGAAA